jgi:hypothetical protein
MEEHINNRHKKYNEIIEFNESQEENDNSLTEEESISLPEEPDYKDPI